MNSFMKLNFNIMCLVIPAENKIAIVPSAHTILINPFLVDIYNHFVISPCVLFQNRSE